MDRRSGVVTRRHLQQGARVKPFILLVAPRGPRSPLVAFALIALCCTQLACSKAPPEKASSPTSQPVSSALKAQPKPAPIAPAASSAKAPGDISDLKITWKTPTGWAATEAEGMMQKARYLAPPLAGDSEGATLTVFYFGPGMGGSVEANIDRWIGQFKNVDKAKVLQSERSKGGLTHHIVEIPEGRFESGMMPGMPAQQAKDGWGMLGAVVEAPSGKYFFKLLGPKKTVAGSKKGFDELLESIQEKP